MEGFVVIDSLGREIGFSEHLERALVIARSMADWKQVRRRSADPERNNRLMAYAPFKKGTQFADEIVKLGGL